MATKTPEDYLEGIKLTHAEAKRLKTSVLTYEKTAAKHTKALGNWVADGKTKLDTTVAELRSRLTKDATAFKDKTRAELSDVEAIRKDTKAHYNRFSQTYNAAMNKKNGVTAKYNRVVKLTSEVSANANEVGKNHTKVVHASAEVKELLGTSRKNEKEISAIHDEAEKVSEEIKNTYGITLDTTMAGTFVDRRNALQKRMRLWEWAYLISVFAIVISVFVALLFNRPDSFVEVLTERLVFVTPLVVVAFVLARQFGHERKLFEEYAFKAAAAQSLRGYTVLLNSEFKDMEEARRDVLKFTIGAMMGIYDRDALAQNSNSMHFMFGNNLARLEAKLEETAHKAADKAVRDVVEEAGLPVKKDSLSGA